MPIPRLRQALELPTPPYRVAPDRVQTDYVQRDAFPEPHTPDRFNRSAYLRYFEGERAPDTILVLMPGIFGGASSMDPLARQLVAASRGLEVWAIDRRANQFEDREMMRRSIQARDPLLAHDFYVTKAGQAGGFRVINPRDLDFMAHWGLELHLNDLYLTLQEARRLAPRVILGGHSLGASIAALYAAYRLPPTLGTDQLGFETIDGLLLIDGAPGRTGAFSLADEGFSLGPLRVIPTIEELLEGKGSPYVPIGLEPYTYAEAEVRALLAHFAPDELAPEGFREFPLTNQALFALSRDDGFAPSVVFSASLGEPQDAELSGNIVPFLLEGLSGVYSQSVVGPSEGAEFVSWTRGDRRLERTDPSSFARSYIYPETNFSEWYFPVRLLIDITRLDLPLRNLETFVPNATVRVPTLGVGAGRGLMPSLDDFAAYANVRPGMPISLYSLPGLTHLDIVLADENPLVPLFLLWLEQLN